MKDIQPQSQGAPWTPGRTGRRRHTSVAGTCWRRRQGQKSLTCPRGDTVLFTEQRKPHKTRTFNKRKETEAWMCYGLSGWSRRRVHRLQPQSVWGAGTGELRRSLVLGCSPRGGWCPDGADRLGAVLCQARAQERRYRHAGRGARRAWNCRPLELRLQPQNQEKRPGHRVVIFGYGSLSRLRQM